MLVRPDGSSGACHTQVSEAVRFVVVEAEPGPWRNVYVGRRPLGPADGDGASGGGERQRPDGPDTPDSSREGGEQRGHRGAWTAVTAGPLGDVEPTESAVVRATDPLFYLVLFAVSTAVVVPMEEVFFRGVVQRHLSEQFHVGVAVGVASLLFAFIHTTTVGTGGDIVELGMFVSLGVVLGISYYHTENLFVPIVGHACFNGVQILVRAVEVTL